MFLDEGLFITFLLAGLLAHVCVCMCVYVSHGHTHFTEQFLNDTNDDLNITTLTKYPSVHLIHNVYNVIIHVNPK